MFTNKNKQLSGMGGESAEGLDERGRSSAVLEAPRPPNSLLSISAAVRPLGPRFPPTPRGGGPPQGKKKKNTAKQMQRVAGQCVRVCMCVYYIFWHACRVLRLRMRASAYVFVYEFI